MASNAIPPPHADDIQAVNATNPYAVTLSEPNRAGPPPPSLTIKAALITIAGTAGGFSVVGAILGAGIALFIPGYYRAVFDAVDDQAFQPLPVALGLGLTQGLFCGLVVGSIAILAVAISRRRNHVP